MSLQKKKAIVTGAGRGIGRAISVKLAQQGVEVLLLSRTLSQLQETAQQVEAVGSRAYCYSVDVGLSEAVTNFFTEIAKHHSSIDFVVNNAGMVSLVPFEKTTEAMWHETLEVNLASVYRMSKQALPFLKKGKGKTILNISSISGVANFERFPGLSAYSAAKAGVIILGEVMARELSEEGISIYTISPGAVDTQMLHSVAPDYRTELKPEDIAVEAVKILKGESGKPSGFNFVIADQANKK